MVKKAQRYLNRLGLHLERAKQRLRRSGFSNFDEERMLAEYVARLVTDEAARVAVDVGAGDGIRGSNTYALFLRGWRGVGFEGDGRRARRLARAYRSLEGVEARHALVDLRGRDEAVGESRRSFAAAARHVEIRPLDERHPRIA